ncbi:universal stress protein [Ramlibacter tataouinensis]|uniref:universal stress protein n=1 Tax=Ramlibacter tataouinensis TaxID=94132 RepID=UPI0022F39F20|nr:universal stress protein [Ramlibacter tataouinensis]WBY01144.1 universal stress protein [Ramlibacter tataouinensis]
MNLLIAIDGSEAALHACRLVAGYAGARPTVRITLLNVQRPPLRLSAQPGVEQSVLEGALREQGNRHLEDARALLPSGLREVASVVRIGPPAETILQEVRDGGAAALVMGSGRHGPLGGYAMGSVALRVAPAAPCPVVIVRPGARLPAERGKTLRVTAPVDGSQESVDAVRRLAGCAGLLGPMHVDLVHFHAGLPLAAAILPPHDDVLQAWSGLETDAALRLPAQILSEAGIAHAEHRLTGAADVEIAAFARRQTADLIAMGTRGAGAMHHLLLGSVALRTAQVSEVPVALMR